MGVGGCVCLGDVVGVEGSRNTFQKHFTHELFSYTMS